jgi:ECF transporter S component (folate family)
MPEKKESGVRRRTRILAQVALLIALEIVLNRYGSINTTWLKIGFSFLPMALCAMLFGPLWAAGAYAIADFTGYWLNPLGPYHPGFTVCAALMGLVYGLFLYRNTFSLQTHSQAVSFEMKLGWERYRFFPN